jgi:transketolase
MNNIPNRQAICEVLLAQAAGDRDIVVLCSDSRVSSSMSAFAEKYPEQFVEMGIAEQNLVSVAAGLAKCGKKAFVASPACFLSSRSMEQIKVDVAYSDANVKLIGVSGGISYGALGYTHHSVNDIAVLGSIPNMRVYLPSDRFQSQKLLSALLGDEKPAYIRVGRNAVPDIYSESMDFAPDKAIRLRDGGDVCIIACGELVKPSLEAAELLAERGISARVIDMYCVRPIDEAAALSAADCKLVVTVEEHTLLGGLGSRVSQLLGAKRPARVLNLGLPDEPVIAGKSGEVFAHYGLDAAGIAGSIAAALEG